MSGLLRLYAPDECGTDGYPRVWSTRECDLCMGHGRVDAIRRPVRTAKPVEIDCPACHGSGNLPIKAIVRAQAEHRCVRCLHPYRAGDEKISAKGEWSPCDEQCAHGGPVRIGTCINDWIEYTGDDPARIRWADPAAPVFARWRILTVHHLDGNKANCEWWNLAALCQVCHLTVQGRVKMDQVYPYEHSSWFRIYAAGFYAHRYLDLDLSRAETEARLDELLALERIV